MLARFLSRLICQSWRGYDAKPLNSSTANSDKSRPFVVTHSFLLFFYGLSAAKLFSTQYEIMGEISGKNKYLGKAARFFLKKFSLKNKSINR